MGTEIPDRLKGDLGLKRPLFDEKVIVIKDSLNLWCHWFRAQRASQLRKDYDLDLIELLSYFSWKRIDTALKYTKAGFKGLKDKMKATPQSYE